VEVKKNHDSFIAGVGKETFDVEMKLSLVDGKILWGKLDNTVEQAFRECTDDTLASCGAPTRNQIKRLIEITLRP